MIAGLSANDELQLFDKSLESFGIVFLTYASIVATELWLVYRKHFVLTAQALQAKQNRSAIDGTPVLEPLQLVGLEGSVGEFGEGSLVVRATIRNSILGRGVWVNEGAVIEDSIVMDFTSVGKGAHVRRCIVDRYNIIPAGQQLGLDPAADRERYRVDASGLVVVPRGGRREFLWNTESP